MNIDKIIEQIEGKQTLLIFLRDNFPEVLEAWKNKSAGAYEAPADEATKPKDQLGNGYREE